MKAETPPERRPLRVTDLRPGDPYELSHGELIEVAPTGGRGSGPTLLGGSVLAWDPAVTEAGTDTGYAVSEDTLRAPDVAIGNVPNTPGWVPGVPLLAIEYADIGQDERGLTRKIRDLLSAGTTQIWVVRLTEPVHVEIHVPDGEVRIAWPGEQLTAPGVLKNAVPVEALYDRTAARRMTLQNLLQREGYESIDAIRAEGRSEADREIAEARSEAAKARSEAAQVRIEAARSAIRDVCGVLDLPLSPEREAALSAMDEAGLSALRARLQRERRWE